MNWIDTADALMRNLGDENFIALAAEPRDASLKEMLATGQTLIEKGIIRQIRDIEIISKPLPLFGSVVLHGGQYSNGHFLPPRTCGGSGFTPEEARGRAYGEAMERYCAGLYNESDFRITSYRDLRGDALAPDSFALFTQEQYDSPGFEYRPFRNDTQANWVQGYSLTQHRPVFVPAAFVYLPYWFTGGETPIGLFPSTGLACGRSFLEATLHGLFEVIERDAIMLMWLRQFASGRLDLHTLVNFRLRAIVDSNENGSIHLFDITTDVPIPTRFALLIDAYRGRSLVACGAATHWHSDAAAERSILEALVVRRAVQKIIRTHPIRNYGQDYEKVREAEEHLNFYTDPRNLSALDFLTGMKASPNIEIDISTADRDVSVQLKACLQWLAVRNFEAVVVDITRPEVAELGLCVVRVIVPGMLPLTFGTQYVCAGGQRLSDASAEKMQLNPMPHPFA